MGQTAILHYPDRHRITAFLTVFAKIGIYFYIIFQHKVYVFTLSPHGYSNCSRVILCRYILFDGTNFQGNAEKALFKCSHLIKQKQEYRRCNRKNFYGPVMGDPFKKFIKMQLKYPHSLPLIPRILPAGSAVFDAPLLRTNHNRGLHRMPKTRPRSLRTTPKSPSRFLQPFPVPLGVVYQNCGVYLPAHSEAKNRRLQPAFPIALPPPHHGGEYQSQKL